MQNGSFFTTIGTSNTNGNGVNKKNSHEVLETDEEDPTIKVNQETSDDQEHYLQTDTSCLLTLKECNVNRITVQEIGNFIDQHERKSDTNEMVDEENKIKQEKNE